MNHKLKEIMTNLAAGHITKEEADLLLNPKESKKKSKTNTHKRKKQLNAKGGK